MASLYEIDERLRNLEEYGFDTETGEIISEDNFEALYNEIQMALNDKIENTVCFIKNLNSDIEAFKIEEENIRKRRQQKEKLVERLKKMIDGYIVNQFTDEDGNVDTVALSKYKMETPKMKLGFRKSVSVNVIDEKSLPKKYLTIKETISPNKKLIKEQITNGKKVKGAELVTNYNLQLK